MKSTFTFLAGLFFTLTSFAEFNDSKLSITVAGNGSIQVYIDNHRYQETDNSILINDLNPGYHTLKVYRMGVKNAGRNRWGRSSANHDGELLYSASLNVRSNRYIDIMINRFGKAMVDERSIDRFDQQDEWNESENGYQDRDPRNNVGRNNDYSSLRDQDFLQVREQVRREHFENSRYQLARQVVERNNLSSDQVKQLLQLFSFESNKLDLAKAAYRNTVDKRNYFMVLDVFSYSRSRDELTQFIERYKE